VRAGNGVQNLDLGAGDLVLCGAANLAEHSPRARFSRHDPHPSPTWYWCVAHIVNVDEMNPYFP